MSTQLKSIPAFASEAEEQQFWQTHDSTDFVDWSRAERVRLPNLKSSTTTVSLRMPADAAKGAGLAKRK